MSCPDDGAVDARGCRNLAHALFNGRGTERNYTRAGDYFDIACHSGDAEGCTGIGYVTARGIGGRAKDSGAARLLYAKGCEGGSARGCYRLGLDSRKRGRDTEAAKFLLRACNGGVTQACAD